MFFRQTRASTCIDHGIVTVKPKFAKCFGQLLFYQLDQLETRARLVGFGSDKPARNDEPHWILQLQHRPAQRHGYIELFHMEVFRSAIILTHWNARKRLA